MTDTTTPPTEALCPACGNPHEAGASFCEACGADLAASRPAPERGAAPSPGAEAPPAADPATAPATAPGAASTAAADPVPAQAAAAAQAAAPVTAPAGEESPLDVGWTGPVADRGDTGPKADDVCRQCGEGRYLDGYCDHCGAKAPDPRDHFAEDPAAWVAGVCDIGKRHSRNEDAMALWADAEPGSRAVLVVCDGVSAAKDSHIASMAAARAARDVLVQPLPRGMGTADSRESAVAKALTAAVTRANDAARGSVTGEVSNPPSCTIAAAVVEDGLVVAGNVGDSRVYWLPDDPSIPASQLGRDDSFAYEQMARGVDRESAETGPFAHSITRWLGADAPDDLTPHMTSVPSGARGWLVVCSDGLWNYVSEPEDLRRLVGTLTEAGAQTPRDLAGALVDHANECGGRDNITVALARVAGQGSTATTGAAGHTVSAAPQEGDQTDG